MVVIGLTVYLVLFLDGGPSHTAAPPRRPSAGVPAPPVVATLAPWRLTAPISRTVVLPWTPAGSDQAVILGGATTGGATASGIFGLDVTGGALSEVGYLRTTLDDAAGAVIDGQVVVFGGTTASGSASATVQALPLGASASNASGTVVPEATVLGTLPQPRTSATAVTVGTTTYLVGGDSGAGPDPAIVATTDGRQFTTVATLQVPVDFPAVAGLGNKLYVFGGTASTGARAGDPVDTIQVVDLTTHMVTDTGHLPDPVTGASAVVLGGDVFVAGGDAVPAATTAPPVTDAASSTTVAGAPPPTSTPTASSLATVWWFDPSSDTGKVAGRLAVSVAHAGAVVLGSTAWLIGGESDGVPVAGVQSLTVAARPARGSHGTT